MSYSDNGDILNLVNGGNKYNLLSPSNSNLFNRSKGSEKSTSSKNTLNNINSPLNDNISVNTSNNKTVKSVKIINNNIDNSTLNRLHSESNSEKKTKSKNDEELIHSVLNDISNNVINMQNRRFMPNREVHRIIGAYFDEGIGVESNFTKLFRKKVFTKLMNNKEPINMYTFKRVLYPILVNQGIRHIDNKVMELLHNKINKIRIDNN
jgi:hypothetical protein